MVAYLYLSFCSRARASARSCSATLNSFLTNDLACGDGAIFLFSKHFLKARFIGLFFPKGEAASDSAEEFRVRFFEFHPFDQSHDNGTNIDLDFSRKSSDLIQNGLPPVRDNEHIQVAFKSERPSCIAPIEA